jgi:hypothetical protein
VPVARINRCEQCGHVRMDPRHSRVNTGRCIACGVG